MKKLLSVLFILVIVSTIFLVDHKADAAGNEWYVAPNGSALGDGTMAKPWDLQTALHHPSRVKPGDTIWVRGGDYIGNFNNNLKGTPEAKITVRAYKNEQPIIKGMSTAAIWFAGDYTHDTVTWGLVITSNGATTRAGKTVGEGIADRGFNNSYVNNIIHDTAQGIGQSGKGADLQIYGNIIYNNGYDSDRGHGHGIYVQNNPDGAFTKYVMDNLVFNQFGIGIHSYGTSNANLNNLHFEGNISFDNSVPSRQYRQRNLIVGGGTKPTNAQILNNYTYFYDNKGENVNLGYTGFGCINPNIHDNYVMGGQTALNLYNCTGVQMSGNIVYGPLLNFAASQYPNNSYLASKPTGVRYFIRPNLYERGRANIVVYNWDKAANVTADISSAKLNRGERYVLRNAQNYFAESITGTYDNKPITIPMTNWTVAAPYGWSETPNTFPQFGAFVLLPADQDGSTPLPPPPQPTPTPTPVPVPTPTPTTPPTTPTTPTPTNISKIYLEAEAGQPTSPMVQTADTAASGGASLSSATDNSGSVSASFNITEAGTYVVWGRVKSPDSNSDSLFVSMDSSSEDVWDTAEGTWSSNWQWSKVNGRGTTGVSKSINPRLFTLSSGQHKITFRGRDKNTQLDRILITNDLSFVPSDQSAPNPPTPPAPVPTVPAPINKVPIVNAGSDITVTLPQQLSLVGTVTDDGLPSNILGFSWSKVAGPGTVTLTNPSSNSAIAGFSEAGNYILRFAASDGLLSAYDDLVAIILPAPIPTTPPVSTPAPISTSTSIQSQPTSCSVGEGAFTGCYYGKIDMTDLKLTRTDTTINFDWGSGSPASSVPNGYFSARWQGSFQFANGTTTFTLTTDDGARLYIDNKPVIDKWFRQSPRTYTTAQNLTAGPHTIKLEYFDQDGAAIIKLSWSTTGQVLGESTSSISSVLEKIKEVLLQLLQQ